MRVGVRQISWLEITLDLLHTYSIEESFINIVDQNKNADILKNTLDDSGGMGTIICCYKLHPEIVINIGTITGLV